MKNKKLKAQTVIRTLRIVVMDNKRLFKKKKAYANY